MVNRLIQICHRFNTIYSIPHHPQENSLVTPGACSRTKVPCRFVRNQQQALPFISKQDILETVKFLLCLLYSVISWRTWGQTNSHTYFKIHFFQKKKKGGEVCHIQDQGNYFSPAGKLCHYAEHLKGHLAKMLA